jgi:hypothetical protein
MFHLLTMKYAIINHFKSQLRQLDSSNPVSDVFGAIHYLRTNFFDASKLIPESPTQAQTGTRVPV